MSYAKFGPNYGYIISTDSKDIRQIREDAEEANRLHHEIHMHRPWIQDKQNPKVKCGDCGKDSEQLYDEGGECRGGHVAWAKDLGGGHYMTANAFCPTCRKSGPSIADEMKKCKKNHIGEKKGSCVYCKGE